MKEEIPAVVSAGFFFGCGCNDYPVRVMWNLSIAGIVIAGIVYQRKSGTSILN
jgi:hypothetical protein